MQPSSPEKEKGASLALVEPLSSEVGTNRRCVSGGISVGGGLDGTAEGAGLGEGLVVLTWADQVRGSMAAGQLRPDRHHRGATCCGLSTSKAIMAKGHTACL